MVKGEKGQNIRPVIATTAPSYGETENHRNLNINVILARDPELSPSPKVAAVVSTPDLCLGDHGFESLDGINYPI